METSTENPEKTELNGVEQTPVDYTGVTNDDFTSHSSTPTEPKAAVEKPAADKESIDDKEEPAAKVIPNPEDDLEEDDSEEPGDKTPKDKEEIKPSKDKDKPGPKRKLDVFEEDDRSILKRAPNDVFNHFKEKLPKLYTELKQLREEVKQSGIERSYLDPEGYKAAPEYTILNTVSDNLRTEVDHWREQARRIEAGKPARDLAVTGEVDMTKPMDYVYGKELPKEDARATVLEKLQEAKSKLDQVSFKRDNFKSAYVQQNSQFMEVAKRAASQYFPYLDNPEKPVKEKLDVLRHELGPHARGLSGELTVRAVYVLGQAVEANKKLKAENAKLKTKISMAGRAGLVGFNAESDKGESGETDIYAGVTNDMFRDR